jgi:hypothetical protein
MEKRSKGLIKRLNWELPDRLIEWLKDFIAEFAENVHRGHREPSGRCVSGSGLD